MIGAIQEKTGIDFATTFSCAEAKAKAKEIGVNADECDTPLI